MTLLAPLGTKYVRECREGETWAFCTHGVIIMHPDRAPILVKYDVYLDRYTERALDPCEILK